MFGETPEFDEVRIKKFSSYCYLIHVTLININTMFVSYHSGRILFGRHGQKLFHFVVVVRLSV